MTIEEIAIEKPKRREVLVRTAAAGICHSDLHFIEGAYPTPVPVVLGVSAGLVLLAIPFVNARFDDTGGRSLPRSSETRQVAEAIDTRFSALTAEPVVALADADPDAPAVVAWLDEVREQLEAVAATVDGELSRPGLTVVEVHADGPTNGRQAQAVVEELRALDARFPVAVGGDPARAASVPLVA